MGQATTKYWKSKLTTRHRNVQIKGTTKTIRGQGERPIDEGRERERDRVK